MSWSLNFNARAVNEAAKTAFTDTFLLYQAENTKVISEVGAFGSHPDADIVDTGQLRASQTPIRTGDLTAELTYPTEYAVYVHEGYTARSGRVIIGRPWTEEAARRLDLETTFARAFEENL